MPKVIITKSWADDDGVVGYAEGKMDGREFTASWGAGSPLGALFYDTWLDASAATTRLIARALTKVGAAPAPQAKRGVWSATTAHNRALGIGAADTA